VKKKGEKKKVGRRKKVDCEKCLMDFALILLKEGGCLILFHPLFTINRNDTIIGGHH